MPQAGRLLDGIGNELRQAWNRGLRHHAVSRRREMNVEPIVEPLALRTRDQRRGRVDQIDARGLECPGGGGDGAAGAHRVRVGNVAPAVGIFGIDDVAHRQKKEDHLGVWTHHSLHQASVTMIVLH